MEIIFFISIINKLNIKLLTIKFLSMGTLLLSGTLLFLLACTGQNSSGDHQSKDVLATVQHDQKQANKTAIILEAFQIVDSDGGSKNFVLRMDKAGKCYLGKEFLGTITAAGELKSETGEVLVRLQGDKLLSEEGKVVLAIKKDGTIANGSGKDITWGADGRLNSDELGLKLVPANSKAKRAASLLMYSYFGSSNTEVQQ